MSFLEHLIIHGIKAGTEALAHKVAEGQRANQSSQKSQEQRWEEASAWAAESQEFMLLHGVKELDAEYIRAGTYSSILDNGGRRPTEDERMEFAIKAIQSMSLTADLDFEICESGSSHRISRISLSGTPRYDSQCICRNDWKPDRFFHQSQAR